MADPREEAFRRLLMSAPQGEPELVPQQMAIEDEDRYRMALAGGENLPQQLGGPSLEEQEAALIDERLHGLAQAYDPQVQAQRYQQAIQNQMSQQVVDVFGQAPSMDGTMMVLPNGAAVDLADPDQVMMFVDEMDAMRQFHDAPGGAPAKIPATPVPQPERQVGPSRPTGPAVARR